MTTPTRPASYIRGNRPIIDGGDMPFVIDEFRKIETSLRDVLDLCPQATTTEPERRRAGMQRLALSPWRPVAGQAADAWVYWDGTQWKYL